MLALRGVQGAALEQVRCKWRGGSMSTPVRRAGDRPDKPEGPIRRDERGVRGARSGERGRDGRDGRDGPDGHGSTPVGRTTVTQGRPAGPLARRVRLTETGWIVTVARPVRILVAVALVGLPGLIGCLYALSLWPGNRAAQLGVLAYGALLGLAFAWYGTLVHTVQLDGAHLHARRIFGPLSLPLTSLHRVVVDDATTLRRSASGELYRARGTQTLIHLGDGSALVCEEPRVAHDLARRLLTQRPRLAVRSGEQHPDEPARLVHIGPASRVRRWGTGVVGPLATLGGALLFLVTCLGLLTGLDGRPTPARPAAQAYEALAWPPAWPAPNPADAAAGAPPHSTDLTVRRCDGSTRWPWSGDRRNGEIVLDAGASPLTASQLAAIHRRAGAVGLRQVSPAGDATTVLSREADGIRWAAAWRTTGDVREARVGVWSGCLDSTAVPDDVAARLRALAGYILTGAPS